MAASMIKTLANINIPNAGTRVQVSAGSLKVGVQGVVTLLFQADTANVGNVFLGDVAVAAGQGLALAPGATIAVNAPLLNGHTQFLDPTQYYVDTATNANKVRVAYLLRG